MVEYIVEEAPQILAKDFKKFFDDCNGFIAGGMIRNYFERIYRTNNDVSSEKALTYSSDTKSFAPFPSLPPYSYVSKDVDVFFKNEEDLITFKDAFYDEGDIFGISYETNNSFGFSYKIEESDVWNAFRLNLDCVRLTYGTPAEIISEFDFTVSQAALFKSDGSDGLEKNTIYLIMHPQFKNHIRNQVMMINHKARKRNIMERTARYMNYGYYPDETESRKIIEIFVNSYPELMNISVDDFVSYFSDFDKVVPNEVKERFELYFRLVNSKFYSKFKKSKKAGKYNSCSKALFNLVISAIHKNSFSHSDEGSNSTHNSTERKYVRSVRYFSDIENLGMSVKERYLMLIDELNLPEGLKSIKPEFELVKLLELLLKHKESIGEEQLYEFVNFVYTMRYHPNSNDTISYSCMIEGCGQHYPQGTMVPAFGGPGSIYVPPQKMIKFSAYDHMEQEYDFSLIDMCWVEVYNKMLDMCENDPAKIRETVKYITEFSELKNVPNYSNFHEALDEGIFDLRIMPSVMFNLM